MPAPRKLPHADLAALLSKDHLRPGQRIGVAVSGGADSVALLLLLLEFREKLGFVPCVVHFNHQLRGRASDADQKFVANLASKYQLDIFIANEDVAALAKRQRRNLEDAARRARYSFFERLAVEQKLDRVAVAHTADDQAETVLAHILRGAGLAGLAGIHPESGAVFRPLLHARRADLRSYLRAKRQPWREDASNRDTARTRARIRFKLMPLLQRQFQPAVVEHLSQLAQFALEDNGWLDLAAQVRVTALAQKHQDAIQIPVAHITGKRDDAAFAYEAEDQNTSEIRRYYAAITRRMIRQIVEQVKPHSGQLSATHVESVLRLAHDTDSGKSLQLPGGVEVRRDHNSLSFLPASAAHPTDRSTNSSPRGYCYPVDLRSGQTEVSLVELSRVLRFRVIDWPAEGRETSSPGAFLDRNKLRLSLVVRNWRPGDSLRPYGHQKAHKLARLLNEMGVSRWEKASWPVLTDGEQVLWARGLPVAAEFAAAPGSAARAELVVIEEREL